MTAAAASRSRPVPRLAEQFEQGLTSPICLTWELTYACNLACVHCLSSSGRRDPAELSTAECKSIIDTLQQMQQHLLLRKYDGFMKKGRIKFRGRQTTGGF